MQYDVIEEYVSWIPYDMILLKNFTLYEIEIEWMNELRIDMKWIRDARVNSMKYIDKKIKKWSKDKHYDRYTNILNISTDIEDKSVPYHVWDLYKHELALL